MSFWEIGPLDILPRVVKSLVASLLCVRYKHFTFDRFILRPRLEMILHKIILFIPLRQI